MFRTKFWKLYESSSQKLYQSFKERSFNRNTVGAVFPKYHEKQQFLYFLGHENPVYRKEKCAEYGTRKLSSREKIRTYIPPARLRASAPIPSRGNAKVRVKKTTPRTLDNPIDNAQMHLFFPKQGRGKKHEERRGAISNERR